MITLIILSLLTAFILIGLFVARRRKRADYGNESIPLFTVPSTSPTRIPRPAAVAPNNAPGSAPNNARSTPPSVAEPRPAPRPDSAEHAVRFAPPAATIRTRDGAVSTLPVSSGADQHDAADLDPTGEAVEGRDVRYWRPADGTLQFLPGRLEIVTGRDVGQEIRFVHTGGPDGARITFGRAEGAPYRHVQLTEPTVSRAHAQMTLEPTPGSPNGSGPRGSTGSSAAWRLENLSSTNPVAVNGRALGSRGGHGASVILAEGDRIEMGEVAFIFHWR